MNIINCKFTSTLPKNYQNLSYVAKTTRLWLWLAIILLAGISSALGQETRATLGGKVSDPKGQAVPGVTVTVVAEETNVKQTTTTNDEGNWRFQALLPGRYNFVVEAQGFKKSVQPTVELQISDQKFIDTTLELGSVNETVTVEADAQLIDTTAAVSGTVLSSQVFEELPSLSNTPITFLSLTPGARTGGPTGNTATLWSNIALSNNSVNGVGAGTATGIRAINYQIDGADNTNQAGQVAFAPPTDAVRELRVITNAYDASIGRQTGATLNMSMKSGGKDFHGTLYEFNQNEALNANRFENNANRRKTPVIRFNEYGGTVGGPVLLPWLLDGRKKQTFFFFSYDGIRRLIPANPGFFSVPTSAERTGDFSQSFVVVNGTRFPIRIFDPATVNAAGARQQFSDPSRATPSNPLGLNIIPLNRISPIARSILALIPESNATACSTSSNCDNFLRLDQSEVTFGSYAGRVDQTWNNNHRSYVSVRYNNFDELGFNSFGGTNPLQGIFQNRVNKGFTADHTWVVSPSFILDVRYNLTMWKGVSENTGGGFDPTQLGFPQSYAELQTIPSMPFITGIVGGGLTNGGLGTNAIEFTDDKNQTYSGYVTQTKGNHTFRYGVEHLIQQQGRGNLGQVAGRFNFTGNWTTQFAPGAGGNGTGVGSSLASFLLGLPNDGAIPNNADAVWKQRSNGLYFQDDWRATKKLTVSLGVRWDLQYPVTEKENRFFSRFDPNFNIEPVTNFAQPNYRNLITPTSTNEGVRLLQRFRTDATTFVARGGILYAGTDADQYVEDVQYKYVQPRVGFAYRIFDNTVIRGGYGRFVQSSFNTASQAGFSQSNPFNATFDNFRTPEDTLANPFPNGRTVLATGNSLGMLTNPGSVGGYTDPDIGRVYTDDLSVHLQHQINDYLLQVSGVYVRTGGLPVGININMPSVDAFRAAFTPTFDATGRPVDTLAGNVTVTNPFRNSPLINTGLQNNTTVSAYSLLRPNPLIGDLPVTQDVGKSTYRALQAKVERRLVNGFSVLGAFSWSRKTTKAGFLNNTQIFRPDLFEQIDTGDRPIIASISSIYEIPIGRGKWLGKDMGKGWNMLVGGWELSGIYQYATGTPISLPTNGAFFEGGDPGEGFDRNSGLLFNTALFRPFPNRNTTVAQLQAYPTWTGVQNLPGFNYVPSGTNPPGNGVYQWFSQGYLLTDPTFSVQTFDSVRNMPDNEVNLGLRKNLRFGETLRLQLRMDAFNVLNSTQFGGPNTDANSSLFGRRNPTPTQANNPRAIQLGIKFYF